MIPRLLLVLSFTTVLAAQSAPDLSLAINGDRKEITIEVTTNVPLRDPVERTLTVDVLGDLEVDSWSAGEGLTCEQRFPRSFVCEVATVEKALMTIEPREPIGADGLGFVNASLTWRERGQRAERRSWRKSFFRYAREWTVTTTDDAGPGSLREAIDDANATCTYYIRPCRIGFELAPAAVIRPLSPLPRITASYLTIESDAPVTIDGSLLQAAVNGFELRPMIHTTLRGLTIDSFSDNGIQILGGDVRVESCVITGNAMRGITIPGGTAWIEGNVISGNVRSGIFQDGGTARIFGNRIGVGADGVTPMPNGASGIFAGRSYNTEIVDNVIAYNGHFGVGTIRQNLTVDVGRNRIVGNGLGPIDIDLDGRSFFTGGLYDYRPPNGPVLLSATYDAAADATTITGRLDNVPFLYFITFEIQFFAGEAAGEAQQFLGAISLQQSDFTVTFPGDLRGRLVTANTIRYLHDEITSRGTSELSAPIEVR